ncbi:hypothetical protein B0H13DRAFT_2286522 [Mycena leptocephala]|nr:hypothetical protein B0H13DRAFT_2286522 [Mycena leptocephala]
MMDSQIPRCPESSKQALFHLVHKVGARSQNNPFTVFATTTHGEMSPSLVSPPSLIRRQPRFARAHSSSASIVGLTPLRSGIHLRACGRSLLSSWIHCSPQISSTSMLLASAHAEVETDGSGGLRFVIQYRPAVVEKELLDSGTAATNGAVVLFRVCMVLHDGPDAFTQHILLHIREAATHMTRGLPAGLGASTETDNLKGKEPQVEDDAALMLAPAPLLSNQREDTDDVKQPRAHAALDRLARGCACHEGAWLAPGVHCTVPVPPQCHAAPCSSVLYGWIAEPEAGKSAD